MMRRMAKLAVLVILVVCLMTLIAGAMASGEIVERGSCGNGVTYILSSEGMLTISKNGDGDGAMTLHPWTARAAEIASAAIGEGVTAICENAFSGCVNLTEISVPMSVNYIGNYPVAGCTSLTTVHYNGLAEDWDTLTFSGEGLDELHKGYIMLDCIPEVKAGENEQVTFTGIRARGAAQNLQPIQNGNERYYCIDINETAVFSFRVPLRNGYSVSFRFNEGKMWWTAIEPDRVTDGYAESDFSTDILETGDEGRIYTVKAIYLPENGEGNALASEQSVRLQTVSHGYSGITVSAPYHYIKPETPGEDSGLTITVCLPDGMTDDQIMSENVWVERNRQKVSLISKGNHTYTVPDEALIVGRYYYIYAEVCPVGYDTYKFLRSLPVFAQTGTSEEIELVLKDEETVIPPGSTVQTGKNYKYIVKATDPEFKITQMYLGTMTCGGMNKNVWETEVFFPEPGTYALNAQGVLNGQLVIAGPITFTAVAENGPIGTPIVTTDKQRYSKGDRPVVTIAQKPEGVTCYKLTVRPKNEIAEKYSTEILADTETEESVSIRTDLLTENESYQIEIESYGVGYSPSITYSNVFYVDAAPQECGNGVTWTLKNGILEIRKTGDGDGKMTSHPWTEQAEEIVEVIIGRGVTSICEDAFAGCSNMVSISIPGSIMELSDAFTGCSSLENVYYNGIILDLGWLTFGTRNQCLWRARVSFGGTREVTAADAEGYSFIVTCKKADDSELTKVVEDDIQQYLYTPYENVTFILNAPDIEGYTKTYRLAYDSAYPGDREDYPASYLIPEQDGTATQKLNIECFIPQMKQFNYKAYAVYVPNDDDDTQPILVATQLIRFKEDPNAGEEPVPAECGNGVTWTLDDGVLTIRKTGDGDGKMTSHPWTEQAEEIVEVIIEEGVTSICEDAFAGCSNMVSISIPSSLTMIHFAFNECVNLQSIYYGGLKEDWIKLHEYPGLPNDSELEITYRETADVETTGIEEYSFSFTVLKPDETDFEKDTDGKILFSNFEDAVFSFDATEIPGYTKSYRLVRMPYVVWRLIPEEDGKVTQKIELSAYNEEPENNPTYQGIAVYIPDDDDKPILVARSGLKQFQVENLRNFEGSASIPETYELGTAGGLPITFTPPEGVSVDDMAMVLINARDSSNELVYLFDLGYTTHPYDVSDGTYTFRIPDSELEAGEKYWIMFAARIMGYKEYYLERTCTVTKGLTDGELEILNYQNSYTYYINDLSAIPDEQGRFSREGMLIQFRLDDSTYQNLKEKLGGTPVWSCETVQGDTAFTMQPLGSSGQIANLAFASRPTEADAATVKVRCTWGSLSDEKEVSIKAKALPGGLPEGITFSFGDTLTIRKGQMLPSVTSFASFINNWSIPGESKRYGYSYTPRDAVSGNRINTPGEYTGYAELNYANIVCGREYTIIVTDEEPSGEVVFTASAQELLTGQAVYFHAECAGAEHIAIWETNMPQVLKEADDEECEYNIAYNFDGEHEFYAVASFADGRTAESKHVTVVFSSAGQLDAPTFEVNKTTFAPGDDIVVNRTNTVANEETCMLFLSTPDHSQTIYNGIKFNGEDTLTVVAPTQPGEYILSVLVMARGWNNNQTDRTIMVADPNKPILAASTDKASYDYGESAELTAVISWVNGSTEGLAEAYPDASISATLITDNGEPVPGFIVQGKTGLQLECNFLLAEDDMEPGYYRILVESGVEDLSVTTDAFYYTADKSHLPDTKVTCEFTTSDENAQIGTPFTISYALSGGSGHYSNVSSALSCLSMRNDGMGLVMDSQYYKDLEIPTGALTVTPLVGNKLFLSIYCTDEETGEKYEFVLLSESEQSENPEIPELISILQNPNYPISFEYDAEAYEVGDTITVNYHIGGIHTLSDAQIRYVENYGEGQPQEITELNGTYSFTPESWELVNVVIKGSDENGNPFYAESELIKPSPTPNRILTLPQMMTTIESEAFANVRANIIVIPDSVTEIADDAFAGSKIKTIVGHTEYLRQYALSHGMTFKESLDE